MQTNASYLNSIPVGLSSIMNWIFPPKIAQLLSFIPSETHLVTTNSSQCYADVTRWVLKRPLVYLKAMDDTVGAIEVVRLNDGLEKLMFKPHVFCARH